MTGFFHVPSAFGVLEEKVIPALFKGKSANDSIRVWVAGCATGEEAYSVAILLFQYASTLKAPPKIELYATDNDKNLLEKAKKGVYPKTIARDMSEYCLREYFVRDTLGYAVVPEVKGSILFSSHDVLIDNSFQSFDLITCRHLLGYLDKPSQSQIITFFHHSLKPGGFLFLGDAEFAEGLPEQFESVDSVFKIYRLFQDANQQPSENIGDEVPPEILYESESLPETEKIDLTEMEEETADVEVVVDLNEEEPDRLYVINHDVRINEEYQNDLSVTQESIPVEETPEVELSVINENSLLLTTSLDVPETHIEESRDTEDDGERRNKFRDLLLAKYAPPSVIVDSRFNILEYTPAVLDVFKPAKQHLVEDYLGNLPDYDRIRLEDAVNQVISAREEHTPIEVKLLSESEKEIIAEVTYIQELSNDVECAQIVYKISKTPADKVANGSATDEDNKAISSSMQVMQNGAAKKDELPESQIEESYLNVVAAAPFPILVHAEGGQIIESSPAWYYMGGVAKDEVSTITEWIKRVKGHRITLKDPELKEVYDKKGVVCISIQTAHHDTKLLAFHSYLLGKDSKGRKLTLTMALDITTYPGNSGIGITPVSADYGLATKKAFLANMSHEIRTPLTSMIGFADYLVDNLSGQDVQFARYISESGNRLLETLNAVLRVASMSSVEKSLKYEALDVTSEVQGVLQLYKPQAEQYDLAIKMVVERPAKAILDRASLRRIVANLLGNAIKFTPEGSIEITVDSTENGVVVAVQDTGIGISEKFLPFVFDRFTQESKGQARSNTGCGLGLSIVRELVEVMGGTIHVETALNKGSKFTVRLPSMPAGYEHKDDAAGVDDTSSSGARRRLLVVEDNVDTQELLILILQDKYEVTLTANATQTLDVARKESFDVILMDLNLGGRRTGFELLREIRKLKAHSEIPVLAVSALPIGVIRKQLIQEGFSGYIAKPFTRARIMDAIEGVLANTDS